MRYTTKPKEIEAFKVEDGRYLIVAEPPRYVDAEEFEDAFEPLPERRGPARRTVKRAKGTGRRRRDHVTKSEDVERATRRNGAAPAAADDNGREPKAITGKRAKARELWDKGKEPPAIATKLKVGVANIYYWRKKDEWPPREDAAPAKAVPAPAAARPTSTGDRPRQPRPGAAVDQILDEVRGQVDRESAQRREMRLDTAGQKTGRTLHEGESVGTGRKVCGKCHMLNNSYAHECGSCGQAFVPKGQRA